MSPTTAAIVGVVVLFFLFLMQMPVAYVMGLVGFLGFSYVASAGVVLASLPGDKLWQKKFKFSLTLLMVAQFLYM